MNRDWLCIAAGVALGEVFAYAAGSFFWNAAIIFVIVVFILLGRFGNTPGRKRMLLIIVLAAVSGLARMGAENLIFDAAVPGDEIIVDNMSMKDDGYILYGNRTMVYYTPDPEEIWDVKAGNRVRIGGEIERIEGPRNPGEFDFALYYKSQGIIFRCFADSVAVTDRHTDCFKQGIYDIRKSLLDRLTLLFGEKNADDAAFLRAALLGDKTMLTDELYDLYRDNGIAHLLAISGLHVSIMGMGLYRLLRRLHMSYTASGLCAGGALVIYNLLTGSSVSTTRAVIMLVMVFLAGREGRSYDLLNAAGLASTMLMLLHPYALFTSGFLLSFGAVISIGGPAATILKRLGIGAMPGEETDTTDTSRIKKAVECRLRRIGSDLTSAFTVSVVVQLFTLPITVYFFFRVSLYGFLLNLIVIPLMTYVLWSGLAALVLSFLSLPLGLAAAGSGHYILKLYKWLCERASALPCSSILIGRPAIWKICVYYFCLFACLYSFRGRLKKQN